MIDRKRLSIPTDSSPERGSQVAERDGDSPLPPEKVLCQHCGRTASNGISCQGMCVADSGY